MHVAPALLEILVEHAVFIGVTSGLNQDDAITYNCWITVVWMYQTLRLQLIGPQPHLVGSRLQSYGGVDDVSEHWWVSRSLFGAIFYSIFGLTKLPKS